MVSDVPDLDLIESLSEIPFRYKDRDAALKRIAELGHKVMGSLACTLVFVDLDHKEMTQLACVSSTKEFEDYMTDLRFGLGQGKIVDIELIAEGRVIERVNLQEDGQGVANPEIARRFGLGAILGIPLSSNGKLLGYINTISAESRPFTTPEKRLMEILARQAVLAMEKFDFEQARERATATLNKLSHDLLFGSPTDFLQAICNKACEMLSVPVCMVWQRRKYQDTLSIATATQTVDEEYRKLVLNLADPRVKRHLSRKDVSYLPNVALPRQRYVFPEEAQLRGWVSLLSAPMWADEQLIGILDVYTKEARQFALWEKLLLGYFANQAAICLQKSLLLKKDELGRKIERLLGTLVEMVEATDPKNVWDLLLKGSLELVGADRGWIRQFDYRSGVLEVVAQHGNPNGNRPSRKLGEGISG